MRFKVTTNGGCMLLTTGLLENVQACILANRHLPLYVRCTSLPIQQGWVFEIVGNVVIFTAYGEIKDDTVTEEWCPWMLQLRRAILRLSTPSPTEGTTHD